MRVKVVLNEPLTLTLPDPFSTEFYDNGTKTARGTPMFALVTRLAAMIEQESAGNFAY